MEPAITLWQLEPGTPWIRVYEREIPLLEQDKLLYGNVYVQRNQEYDVHVRLDPRHVVALHDPPGSDAPLRVEGRK